LKRGTRDDIEQEDDQESFFRWLEENPNAGQPSNDNDDEQELDYDEEGNIIVPEKSKVSVYCLISLFFKNKKINRRRKAV
jgi:ATP-dependent RNA helicase DDX42